MRDFQKLIYKMDGGVATITINRPDVMNALNRATLDELEEAVRDAGSSGDVRALIITGAGEKAFVAGADINELADIGANAARAFARRAQHVFQQISGLGKPVIAAVNGFALGGGCELALCCHIRIGSTKARLGQPEVKLGVIPGWGGTQRLPRLVGLGRALEILLTGDPIGAEEALRIGLLNRVVEPDQLLTTCEQIAGKIAGQGPIAVRLTIDAAQRGLEGSLADGLLLEADLFGLAASTADWREGTAAFISKRRAEFRGE